MSKQLCKGGCGNPAKSRGWCKIKWVSGKKCATGCPVVEKKRGDAISKFRIAEAKFGKNPMQNPEICRRNHSITRNKRAAETLIKLGKLGRLPQQTESPELREKRRKRVSRSLKKVWANHLHPLQNETIEKRRARHLKIAHTIEKMAASKKLFVQNMTTEQKKAFGRKISATIRRRIKNGTIRLSPGWKKVPYGKVVLRSRWEKETAQFLDEQRIDWEYECMAVPYFDTQRKCVANTIPDFYLPKYSLFIEVKSNCELRSVKTRDKLNGVRKQGYRMVLFGKKEIDKIETQPEALVKMIKNEEN